MDINEEREERINYRILVDCYDEDEVKSCWFAYMQDTLSFPFTAEVSIKKRSGDQVQQTVDILGLAGDERFGNDMLVEAVYDEDIFMVYLSDLTNIKANEETIEAIADWKYWNR